MRIVAGQAKGRRLAGPPEGTRPTSDRAREAMFNTLAGALDLDGARVLDLFAGTGAVGLEALSRGAAHVTFVESGRAALAVLRRNIETVGLPGAEVVPRSVTAHLERPPDDPFDLVFADPPYAMHADAVSKIVTRLAEAGWLSDDGHVVVERSVRDDGVVLAEQFVTSVTNKRYGNSVLWYGRRR